VESQITGEEVTELANGKLRSIVLSYDDRSSIFRVASLLIYPQSSDYLTNGCTSGMQCTGGLHAKLTTQRRDHDTVERVIVAK
jgi:hypothetical protein